MGEIKSIVPEGKSGSWRVEKFTVTEKEIGLFNMRALWSPGARTMKPGNYTRLMRGGALIMSDTNSELQDLWGFGRYVSGDVLINGLGLGIALQIALAKESVTDVTVIEQSADVIALVAPSFASDPRVTIHEADAYEWQPPKGKRYDVVWHDIWDDICADNLPGMHKLHRRYGRRTGWQGSWCRGLCERYA